MTQFFSTEEYREQQKELAAQIVMKFFSKDKKEKKVNNYPFFRVEKTERLKLTCKAPEEEFEEKPYEDS